jgi:hypothetical protein
MSVFEQAKSIYNALKYDPVSIQEVRDEYKALALSMATDPNASSTVTSTTINGQTISTRPNMTNGQRMQILRYVCYFVDNGGVVSTTSITTF